MVCPDCVRPRREPHALGCPSDIEGISDGYRAGWLTAKDAFGELVVAARQEERHEFAKLLRSLADEMDTRNPGTGCV